MMSILVGAFFLSTSLAFLPKGDCERDEECVDGWCLHTRFGGVCQTPDGGRQTFQPRGDCEHDEECVDGWCLHTRFGGVCQTPGGGRQMFADECQSNQDCQYGWCHRGSYGNVCRIPESGRQFSDECQSNQDCEYGWCHHGMYGTVCRIPESGRQNGGGCTDDFDCNGMEQCRWSPDGSYCARRDVVETAAKANSILNVKLGYWVAFSVVVVLVAVALIVLRRKSVSHEPVAEEKVEVVF